MTAFDFAFMTGTAIGTDEDVFGGEFRAVSGADFGRQLGLYHPVGPAFVINQAARPEFRVARNRARCRKEPAFPSPGTKA